MAGLLDSTHRLEVEEESKQDENNINTTTIKKWVEWVQKNNVFGFYIWVYKQFLLEIVITCSIYILNTNKPHYRASASAFPRPKRRRRGGRSSSSRSSIAMGHGRPKTNSPGTSRRVKIFLGNFPEGALFFKGLKRLKELSSSPP